MDTADVMEVLVNHPHEWVRIKAPVGALPTIASELNRTPGFEVNSFGGDVIARWSPVGNAVPTLADIPQAPRGFEAPTVKELEGALAVKARELAPPTFSEVKPYDPNEPARPEAFRPKPFFASRPSFEPTEAQLRSREAFTARRKAATEAKQERLRLKAKKP